ncbi:unnamed protein product [Ilex paraguariensis]|uniref:Uncharacterized protein n=2 Tax=Ilex paraguariensis TaxID=185542 RepID=A0ABC8SVM2_9AQUA
MESSLVVLALAWLAALAFISKKIRERNPPKRIPPGPKPWPVVGNLHQLGTLPHITLHFFAKKYGEIMQVKYGSRTVVVASSPKMAEEFLKTYDSLFASRPPLASGKYTGYDFQDMTWAPYGPHWRKARRIYLSELFNPNRLDSFEYIRVEERLTFFASLYAQTGNPIILKNYIRRYTLSSISRVVLGDKYFSDHKTEDSLISISEFHGMIDEWMVLNGVLNIGDWIPWLRFFDVQGYVKRMKVLTKKFDKFHNYVLADHKAKKDLEANNFVPKDMVDVLLQMTEEDTDPEVKLTVEAVKALVHGRDISMLGQDFTLLPFGSGRRRCPGYNLGLRIVRTTVANVFHGFNWKFPEGVKPEDICMVERYGLTTCPEVPVTVIPEPRLPIHLYQ